MNSNRVADGTKGLCEEEDPPSETTYLSLFRPIAANKYE